MTKEKGLVMVFTGNGKGKTTASLGMAVRAWGQGMKVLILQFIKGDMFYGELNISEKLAGLEIRPLGKGFTNTGILEEHLVAAKDALCEARREISGGNWDMIILDEIIYALDAKLFSPEALMELIDIKPEGMHLVFTGRNANQTLIDRADLVTEMKEIKHPFMQGIRAQKGVEF
ncbi:MAG: cob(I)yrinic acid a,c-diamide adenosyltransferase [Peptococcaceae bacterium]|nr:cob(I)yrinic acid a,c-diamide adenosyltransferase [Peptococcaceae bacterium]